MNFRNRDDLIAAQFMLKPTLYCDWIWQERVKAYPPVKSKMRPEFKWMGNVILFKREKANG